jgi:hypothetical protein
MIGYDAEKAGKSDRLDDTVDKIRRKYGNTAVRRATVLQDQKLFYSDVKGEHIVHPNCGKNQLNDEEV